MGPPPARSYRRRAALALVKASSYPLRAAAAAQGSLGGPPTLDTEALNTKIVFKMKNVTVTLDEETARWARIEAARRGVSVSSLLRDLLKERMTTQEGYADAMKRYLEQRSSGLGGPLPSRDELHDRASLR
jgi:tetrahydromethanopterin S-methyltransferase subunit B